jgi:leucyl aminopeptidase
MFCRNRYLSSLHFFSFLLLATPAIAAPTHTVVAPLCLLQNNHADYKTLATHHQLALLSTNTHGIKTLITAKAHQTTPCGGFIDVTNEWKKSSINATRFLSTYETTSSPHTASTPYTIRYQAEVEQLIKQINPQHIWDDLTTLSNTHDRYAYSENGKQTAEWIKTTLTTLANNHHRNDISVFLIKTGEEYIQPSVVVKIGLSNTPAVVLGAHMDSILSEDNSDQLSPGADDDGSGSATLLEVARTLINSNMHFNNPIYLVWYAAEEEGLIGSSYVVNDFVRQKIKVAGVLQLDMTGYEYQNSPNIWLIDDYVNRDLTTFLGKLITTYTHQTVGHTECGYACSDHANWTRKGFASAFPTETKFGEDNPDIHTENDTMEKLTLSHMADFAKLGTAFAVELAEPNKEG